MRIGIVNDVPLVTEALRRAVTLKPQYQVIWTAKNGTEAVDLCARQKPDLVLMDLLMPGMDGVEATRQIMANSPCAILVVTVSVGANAWRVFEAMGHGALDAVDTPTLNGANLRESAAPLLAKLEILEGLIGEKQAGRTLLLERAARGAATGQNRMVAIGSSAGGPAALARLLAAIPKGFPAAIVIIQHVDVQFAAGMADWLDKQCALPVRVATEGEVPLPGNVLLAGSCDHLVLTAGARLAYTPEPRDYVYRPSVDVFFRSLTQFWRGSVVGVLLTGMGRDGALGLKALRNQGHFTIAQDQATSAVYGMPKAAASVNAAVEILPIDLITPRLIRAVSHLPR
ncbi:MAG: chemotaxis response regulator protein-glutamate methylesterase [Verrucomicrobiota bacterium]